MANLEQVKLLHGHLDISVYEAKNLRNSKMINQTSTDMFGKELSISARTKIEGLEYVTVSVGHHTIARTSMVCSTSNPVWNQHLKVAVAHFASSIAFHVSNSDVKKTAGAVVIGVRRIIENRKLEGSFIINYGSRSNSGVFPVLKISIQYTPVEEVIAYQHGVGSGPNYIGVPDTYFPLRQRGKVTLYQDAHVPEGSLPILELDQGVQYEHGKCWSDIYNAISDARHLIFITGWSLYHKVRLIRDDANAPKRSLGELLKYKSRNKNVNVLLLIWDDPSSVSNWAFRTEGRMQTHDEETLRFFSNSLVHVCLTEGTKSEDGTVYAHHQKAVIVDVDAGNKRRKIVAFIGGLDLCDGRYDTPEHPLFRTSQTLHKYDYRNPSFTGPAVGCPREAWHDLHCKIEGPAAHDVLKNFEERWLKASKKYNDVFLQVEHLPNIVGKFEAPVLDDNDPEAWHVQIFRSIDSNSVKGFPEDSYKVKDRNLVFGENVVVDTSLHTAYVNAIRAAQRFIYIENQSFLGSSYNWTDYKNLGENNLIPMEIALKIANKIRARERFAAYIVVPMWPEGIPTNTVIQSM